jgi:peptidoglycan-associated lipoprotein
MSSLTYERPKDLQWITVGDMLATSGSLGSTINIGGLGISKVYQMDPYLIKQPTLNLMGAATLPSQVDIYLDGALVGRQNVQPGRFELQNLNYYGGARNVELVIKDPFGNEQRLRSPFYFTDILLKKGLNDYSYNIGFLREQYGTESNDYNNLAFSAFHRYGVSDSWTVGASAEASNNIYNGSVQTSFLIPRVGVATAALAESAGASDNTGSAVSLSHSYQKDSFGSSLLFTTYTHDYTTIGSSSLAEKIKYVGSIALSYTTTNWGAFSIGYSEQRVYDSDTKHVPSANYTYNLTRALTLSVTTQAVINTGTDYQVFASLNYFPAKDIQVTTQVQSTRDGNTETLQLQKNTPTGEGLGYHAFFNRNESNTAGTTNLFNPYIQYNGRYGTYSLDSYFQQTGGTNSQTYNASAAGALVYVGGFFGFTRPVNNSFSIVMADKLSDVGVMVNNEEIGKTDSLGRMIIPTMRSYNVNQISLVENNIPLEYTISGVNANVLPPIWSGSCVGFEAAKIQAVTGVISVKKRGEVLPIEFYDVIMIVNGKEFKFPTGRNGEFYFETVMKTKDGHPSSEQQGCRALKEKTQTPNKIAVPGIYQASFEYEGKAYPLTIAIPPSDDVIIDIGKIVCEIDSPSNPPLLPVPSQVSPSEPGKVPAMQIQAAVEQPPTQPFDAEKEKVMAEQLAREKAMADEQAMAKRMAEEKAAAAEMARKAEVNTEREAVQFDNIHFDFDSYVLRPDAREILDKHAKWLKAHPNYIVSIEGNCDERGSVKHNLALGRRRADNAMKYLVDLGVDKSRINTISYGKGRPIDPGHNEKAWAKNRRNHFSVTLSK